MVLMSIKEIKYQIFLRQHFLALTVSKDAESKKDLSKKIKRKSDSPSNYS